MLEAPTTTNNHSPISDALEELRQTYRATLKKAAEEAAKKISEAKSLKDRLDAIRAERATRESIGREFEAAAERMRAEQTPQRGT